MQKTTIGTLALLSLLGLSAAASAQVRRSSGLHRAVPVMRVPVVRGSAAVKPPTPAATASSKAATPAPVPAVVDAGAVAHAGTPPADEETAAEKAVRRAYVQKRATAMRSIVRGHGKAITADERTVIRQHWHESMRLWRIRHVAAENGDKASVARVDAILARADKKTDAKLTALAAKAPAAVAAKSSGAKQ